MHPGLGHPRKQRVPPLGAMGAVSAWVTWPARSRPVAREDVAEAVHVIAQPGGGRRSPSDRGGADEQVGKIPLASGTTRPRLL